MHMHMHNALTSAINQVDDEVLVVASSDMSHYLPEKETRRQDQLALKPILDFDPQGLHHAIRTHHITMCGYIPAIAMLSSAQKRTTSFPRLIDYSTSGQAFGDYQRVVGYAGIVVAS